MSYRDEGKPVQPTPYWKYFLKSLIVLLILALLISMLWGVLTSKDENLLRGVLIGVGVVSFLVYGGYWIYIIVHETRIRKGLSYGTDEQNTLKKKRLAILKAHKIQAKVRGDKLSKEEIEDINSGKYDNEVSNG
mgnify:FL=1